jgi:hypothetical protein
MSCMWEEERGTDRCFCALDESTLSRMRSGGHSLNDEGSHVYRILNAPTLLFDVDRVDVNLTSLRDFLHGLITGGG